MCLSSILTTFFLTFYDLKLWLYTPAYKNREAYCDHNIYEFPNSYNSYNWKGLMMKDKNRRYEAIDRWFDGLTIRPNDFRLLFNTAQLLGELGYIEKAFAFFEKVKASLIPDMMEEKLTNIVNNKQYSLYQHMLKDKGDRYDKFINSNSLKKRYAGYTPTETAVSLSTTGSVKRPLRTGEGTSTKEGKQEG